MEAQDQEQYKALFNEALELKDKVGCPSVDTALLILIYDAILDMRE